MTPVVHAPGLAVNRLSLLNESRTIRRIYQGNEAVMIKIFSYLSFWVVIDWINIVSSINFAAQAAFLYGFRLPVVQRRDAFAPAPVDDGTYAAPFVELQESMIDDKPTGAVI